jgi:galactokinase
MDLKHFSESFYEKFGDRSNKHGLFFSPGRVNLIGEHTDYNGGFVFPCALNYGTYLAIRKTPGKILKFSTLNFNEDAEAELNGLFVKTNEKWINYPLGVINEFLKEGINISGLELLYYGDVPNGAGLSSSASIEMVTAVAINEFFNAGFDTLQMVKMSQRAENQFVGMNCGIMDQFSVGFGKKDHAIFLNCDTLFFENVPVILTDCSLIITNTNKRRGLTDSKYNERRSECDKAVELLQAYKQIKNLSELNTGEISILEKYIKNPVIRKRAKHVISENGRVVEAVMVLKANNIVRFGELQKGLPGVNAKMLTKQLRELENDGVIKRTIYPEVPPRVEYIITDFGKTLLPIMEALCSWGANYLGIEDASSYECPTKTGKKKK